MTQFNDPRTVARRVQEHLRDSGPVVARARVLSDEVAQQASDGTWWYVPVSLHRDTENMHTFYEAFSVIEEALEEQENLRVLLVPRIIPFQRWQDVA